MWLFEDLRKRDVPPDFISYMPACEEGGQWEQALWLLEDMRWRDVTPDVSSCSSSVGIPACDKCGKYELALLLFEEPRRRGVTPDVISYKARFSARGKGGHWEQALLLLA